MSSLIHTIVTFCKYTIQYKIIIKKAQCLQLFLLSNAINYDYP